MFSSEQWLANSGADFYNGQATQSLRFDDGSSAFLSRTPAGASNQKTWTFSAWIKPSNVTISRSIFARHDSGSNTFLFRLDGNDDLQVENYTSGGYQLHLVTDAKFRDTSAWYHVVLSLDTTQGTAANRAKLYVNGVQQTSLSASTYPSQDADLKVNAAAVHRIGARAPDNYFDGYMAEVNFVDGTQLAPTSFGETKNGVWIPIDTSGLTFGTNGFRLDFADNAVDAPTSEGTEDTDNIGSDSSGEHNNWTSSGIVASDCAMPDSPENNFATLNSLYATANTNVTLSEGNLKATVSQVAYQQTFGSIGVSSGKWYVEMKQNGTTNSSNMMGISSDNNFSILQSTSSYIGSNSGGENYAFYMHNGQKYSGGSGASYGSRTTDGQIIGVALDLDNGKIYFSVDGTYIASGDPAGGTGFAYENIASSTYYFGITLYTNGIPSCVWNFGQDSTFVGSETATSNADGNGYGAFHTAPPSGFLSLCTANLPEPTIGANSDTQADDYFETVLWTGNATDDTAIAVNFKPDFTWIKQRTSTAYHNLSNSTVGATKALFSNATDAEGTNSDRLKAFTSTGFTLGDASDVNAGSNTYVAWNWLANGGTTVTNESGSIDSTVQANTDAGFSIVTYTGNQTAGATIGHGLGVKPDFIIFKSRSAVGSWYAYHKSLTANNSIYLNLTAGSADRTDSFNDTEPTTSLITFGNGSGTNANSTTMVAYCFAGIEGYSKFGSYTGNGNADGTFVFTGFRPAFFLVKPSSATGAWLLHDTARNPQNVSNLELQASATSAEYSTSVVGAGDRFDILSNGFKHRSSNEGANTSGGTFIYMAFAEQPFKYANAR